MLLFLALWRFPLGFSDQSQKLGCKLLISYYLECQTHSDKKPRRLGSLLISHIAQACHNCQKSPIFLPLAAFIELVSVSFAEICGIFDSIKNFFKKPLAAKLKRAT